jgi:RNA polymerase sigma-70 factor (ECF subfamily)
VPPDPDPRTDSQLLAAAGSGDAAAFDTLYLRHRDWVVNLAYRFTHDKDEALDIMQESFAYLLGRLPGFTLTARLTTFLYPVVKHNALAARRKGRRTVLHADVPEPAAPQSAAGGPGDPPPGAAVRAAADSLPEAQRETLLMRFVDGMALQEIALALNIPVGTVKSRLHTALSTLRADPRTLHLFDLPPDQPRDGRDQAGGATAGSTERQDA